MPLRFLVKWSGYFQRHLCHSRSFCHSRAGGNLRISLDPRFHGDDRKKHRDDKNKEGMTSITGMTSKISIIIATLLSLTSAPVYADNNNSNNYTCSLTTVNVDFGYFYPYDATFDSTTSTVQVTCDNTDNNDVNVSYVISFSTGVSGSYSARLIKNGTKTVSYNLYKDSAYTQILGAGSGSTYTLSKAYSLKKNKSQTDNFAIYGKIPVQPMAVPGFVYADTITATLTY